MQDDIKIIRLIRKAVIEKREEMSMMERSQRYFATDYFDILQVDEKSMSDSIADIMDLGREKLSSHETAAQSYALYCSAEMLVEYENSHLRSYRKNPFVKYNGMKYLSIIHVYIAPEILARMSYNAQDIWDCGQSIIMKPFINDLYEVLDLFCEDLPHEEFTARLYLMLSAGDFAIVVRSRKPETSYYISTYLRKREAGKKDADIQSSGYVIYKTYTLLTIDNKVVYREEDRNGNENYFIVRGCYSNKFWKEQQLVKKYLEEEGDNLKEIYPMSGRYDFTARLTEQEFFDLLPEIVGNVGNRKNTHHDIVRYISYLLQNNYLSYINERYLMAGGHFQIEQELVSKFVVIDNEGMQNRDLFERNEEKIDQLLSMHENLADAAGHIMGYRKQIGQDLILLKKQILLCRSINELSDTRVYARVLAEQLKVVLESAYEYAEICGETTEMDGHSLSDRLDLLEQYLRKALWTLDSYAQYIRNNNLQSLQTPNYNLETAMGMEKILIGYSELLWKFLDYYQREMKHQIHSVKCFLPIIVPSLYNDQVGVEVLFPDIYSDISTESGRYLETSAKRYLMVVGSTTLEEICDVPTMIAALFHEVAHQLRYEPRDKRNNALIEASAKEVMTQLADRMAETINSEIGFAADSSILYAGLKEGLTQAFLKSKYNKKVTESDEFKSLSLRSFEKMMDADLNKLYSSWVWESKLEARIKEFIIEICYGIVFEDDSYQKELQVIKVLLEKDEPDSLERIKEWAFRMSWMCAYNGLKEDERRKAGIKRWSKSLTFEMADRALEWHNNFEHVDDINVQRIWKSFDSLADWIDAYDLDYDEDQKDIDLEMFEKNLYLYMKKYWDDIMQKSVKLLESADGGGRLKIPSYRYWTLVGRYLGLDYETKGGKRFHYAVKKEVKKGMSAARQSFIGLYREETADILMCNIVDLSVFGYLNLAAFLFPQNMYHTVHGIERVFCVLYVHWCHDSSNDLEKGWDNFRKICSEIFDRTKEYSGMAVRAVSSGYSEQACCFSGNNFWEPEDALYRWNCQKQIEREMSFLKKIIHETGKKTKSEKIYTAVSQIKNAVRIYDILIELIQNGRYFWNKLLESSDVLADLSEGDHILRELSGKMKSSEDRAVRKLTQALYSISQYLGNPRKRKMVLESGMLHKNCI